MMSPYRKNAFKPDMTEEEAYRRFEKKAKVVLYGFLILELLFMELGDYLARYAR